MISTNTLKPAPEGEPQKLGVITTSMAEAKPKPDPLENPDVPIRGPRKPANGRMLQSASGATLQDAQPPAEPKSAKKGRAKKG